MGIEPENIQSLNFPKKSRLNSKKLIDTVFLKGKSIFIYPFSIKYLSSTDVEGHQVLVSVSKKKFKRAVDRNLVKRRVKEAYRLNRLQFLSFKKENQSLLIAYIYIAKEIHDYRFIESKLIESLKRLNSKPINLQ
ncbi:ribonuclease P protein component [Reichenbachiella sp. MALMAid0571]|uniref:ribonuclease P protein component n=1 Tax=Reichenbachiella sp. MALMAid0571 TaxID=3143939 RepID=UPI0032DFEF05